MGQDKHRTLILTIGVSVIAFLSVVLIFLYFKSKDPLLDLRLQEAKSNAESISDQTEYKEILETINSVNPVENNQDFQGIDEAIDKLLN